MACCECSPLTEAGPRGAAGNDGQSAYSVTTAAFTQPAVGATVLVQIASTAWFGVGQTIFVENGGYYEVITKPNTTTATLENLGVTGFAAPAASVALGSTVTSAAIIGGAAGGDLTGTYPDPTITSDAVTYDKMQDTTVTDVLLGRSTAGAGTVEEVACTSLGRLIIASATETTVRTAISVAEILYADRTYYVSTTGSDVNTGLTIADPFQTVQKAVNIVESLVLNNFNVTIQLADGTYAESVTIGSLGIGSNKYVIIQGNAATPANTIISATSANAINVVGGGARVKIKDVSLTTNTVGQCIYIFGSGYVEIDGVDFTTCAGSHMFITGSGATLLANGNYTVSGNATSSHIAVDHCAFVSTQGRTITYSNTPAFGAANFSASRNGVISCWGMTFTNGATVTGTRFGAAGGGVIDTNGGGANYIPGNAAGAPVPAATEAQIHTATYGQYV